jgi:hypothetical protein
MKDHYIILEHGVLMEYERNMFWSLEKFYFHNHSCYFDVFFFIILSFLDFNFETSSKYILMSRLC